MPEDVRFLMINCEGCSKSILEGDKVLLIQWHDELPEVVIHKSFECLLMLEGINEGVGSFKDKPELVEVQE